jgi:hypothetical protein
MGFLIAGEDGFNQEENTRKRCICLSILLPLRYPGIRGDKRMAFYSEAESFSNQYAFSIGLGGSHVHAIKLLKLSELVKFDGIVVCNGVRGSSALYQRWIPDCADYNISLLFTNKESSQDMQQFDCTQER